MKECIFCRIYRDRQGTNYDNKVIYFGRSFYLHFDDVPISPGHLEIVSNRHIRDMGDLKKQDCLELVSLIKKAKKVIESYDLKSLYKNFFENYFNENFKYYAGQMLKSKFLGKKPAGYNIGVNEGLAGGQTVPHLHIHIIPRYKGDVLDPTGGVRNIIPKLGNYKKLTK